MVAHPLGGLGEPLLVGPADLGAGLAPEAGQLVDLDLEGLLTVLGLAGDPYRVADLDGRVGPDPGGLERRGRDDRLAVGEVEQRRAAGLLYLDDDALDVDQIADVGVEVADGGVDTGRDVLGRVVIGVALGVQASASR